MASPKPSPSEDLQRIIDSARRLGVELDEEEAMQWLTAIATTQNGDDISIDTQSGVFGHRISMLDFNPHELAHFRKIGALVGFPDQPGRVETALALSGSAAQSKIQTYPGDADYFERINIIAATREEACQILAEIMRAKALDTLKGPDYQLIEIKFGNYPYDAVRGSKQVKKGNPVSWSAGEVVAGELAEFSLPDGTAASLHWEDVQNDPGLVQTGLGGCRQSEQEPGERQQYAGCYLGRAGWQHCPVGWLHGSVLSGSVPGSRIHPGVQQIGQTCGQ